MANSCLDNEPLTNVNVNTIGLDNWQLPSNQLSSNLIGINNPKNYSHTHYQVLHNRSWVPPTTTK
jgi:hypothetical protein